MTPASDNPFVVGQWVRGDRFYGRQAQISEILDGPRNSLWLLGTQRIGKTSLLRQLELIASESSERGYFPLFWDFQGAETPEELNLHFKDALLDARERLERLGVEVEKVEGDDLFASLGRLRRQLRSRSLRLLLLCDEVEELIRLRRTDPALLRKLRRATQSREDIRSVLASTIRLWALAEQKDDTSPFLHGFTPPLYLQTLSAEEALTLIRQDHLSRGSRPGIDERSAERIRSCCDNHPYLIQLVCRRYLETADLEEAIEQVAADSMLSHIFAVDFNSLSESERDILGSIAQRTAESRKSPRAQFSHAPDSLSDSLLRLENLGFVRRDDERQFVLANYFFRRWLQERAGWAAPQPGQPSSVGDRVTEIVAELSHLGSENKGSAEDLLPLVYDDLRQLAARYMSRERREHTLQPTAVVHEAYLKLVDQSRVNWQGRSHFFAVGAKIMRRILIDHARGKKRVKRGADWQRVTLSNVAGPFAADHLDFEQLLTLNAALKRLARTDERQARIVELRFFGGLNMAEVANVLGVSKRTVEGDWRRAREWLKHQLSLGEAS